MSGAGVTIVGLVLVLVLGAAAQTFRFPGDSSADVAGDSDDDNGEGAADGQVPGEMEMETRIDVRDAKHLRGRQRHLLPPKISSKFWILENLFLKFYFMCVNRYEDGRKDSVGSTFYISLSCIAQNDLDESTKAQSSSSGMLRIPQCSLRPAHCQP